MFIWKVQNIKYSIYMFDDNPISSLRNPLYFAKYYESIIDTMLIRHDEEGWVENPYPVS